MRTFGESGSPRELYAKYGLDADGIAATTGEVLAGST
jgi:transketolase